MSASLTGRYARFGCQALAGVQAWVADVNEAGGVRPGPNAPAAPPALRVYDDASRAAEAARATHRLIVEDGVELLLGPYSSALTRAAAEAAATHGVPLWNHGGAADDLYERANDWIIGVLSPASRYFAGLVDLAQRAQPGASRLALIGVRGSPFARSVLAGGPKRRPCAPGSTSPSAPTTAQARRVPTPWRRNSAPWRRTSFWSPGASNKMFASRGRSPRRAP